VATGASALWLGIDSETRLRGRGVSARATCDGFFFKDREIAVVGGGDTAFEEATYLTHFATKVHLLHRRDSFRASKIMVERAHDHPKIEIHPNQAVDGCSARTGPRPEAARHGLRGASGLPVGPVRRVRYRPGHRGVRDWLESTRRATSSSHDETGSKIDGVFIAGDVDDHRYRQAVTAAGDGCKAAIDAERWLEAQGITEVATATAW
jgi:thioredoxin reductase (NADPH)